VAPRRNTAQSAARDENGAVPGPALCVYCRRQPVDPRWRPFCSDRCRLQDLGRWIDGDYRIAGESISSETGGHDADDGS
jgi:endogenous inhibitor of DNA gyrase (YacG/DUF329 family)